MYRINLQSGKNPETKTVEIDPHLSKFTSVQTSVKSHLPVLLSRVQCKKTLLEDVKRGECDSVSPPGVPGAALSALCDSGTCVFDSLFLQLAELTELGESSACLCVGR